jgi:L-alanine-DL-glutamate epimerase-like enolase superfamily enzyme
VAHLAHAFDVPVSSHVFSEMSLQIMGALDNGSWLEHMPWFEPLYGERIALAEGKAVVPEKPGWGFSFDMKAVERFKA